MERTGLVLGIFGGFGLGLLIGSGFHGTVSTIAGATITAAVIIAMVISSLKRN